MLIVLREGSTKNTCFINYWSLCILSVQQARRISFIFLFNTSSFWHIDRIHHLKRKDHRGDLRHIAFLFISKFLNCALTYTKEFAQISIYIWKIRYHVCQLSFSLFWFYMYICIDNVMLRKNVSKSKPLKILRRKNDTIQSTSWLKLVRTNLNYRVIGTSTANIFIQMIILSVQLGRMSCLIIFVWDQSTCQERVDSDKIRNEKLLSTVRLEPTTLRFLSW